MTVNTNVPTSPPGWNHYRFVDFTRSNSNFSISPTRDETRPFTTVITGVTAGTAQIRANLNVDPPYLTSGVPSFNSSRICPQVVASVCVRSAWVNGACGAGTCTDGQRQQTRSVACGAATTQCINDASCITPPPTPTGFSCTAATNPDNVHDRLRLSWNSSTGANHYELFRCNATTNPGCTPSFYVGTIAWRTAPQIVDGHPNYNEKALSPLNPNTTYRYQVRAVKTVGGPSALTSPIINCTTECRLDPWVNDRCGGGSCGPNEMRQTRQVLPAPPATNACTDPREQCLSEAESVALCQRSWFQTRGGPAYARKTFSDAIRSSVPGACYDLNNSDVCRYAITAYDLLGGNLSDGIPMTGGGNIRANGRYSERPDNPQAVGPILTHRKYIYDFFVRYTGLRRNPEDYALDTEFLEKPSESGTYYASATSDFHLEEQLTIREPWNVSADESIVFFIEGDLVLNDQYSEGQLITVEEGGFLAFLVKGNIIIRNTVGNDFVSPDTTNLTTNLEGIFIADGTLTVESTGNPDTEKQLIAAGTYAGHQGVILERSLESGVNTLNPAEIFIYRPDFIRYMPDWMTRPHIIWQETN